MFSGRILFLLSAAFIVITTNFISTPSDLLKQTTIFDHVDEEGWLQCCNFIECPWVPPEEVQEAPQHIQLKGMTIAIVDVSIVYRLLDVEDRTTLQRWVFL